MNKREELKTMLVAVDELAEAMKKKLRRKAADDYSGGLDPAYSSIVGKGLMKHAKRLTGYCTHCEVQDGEHDREEGAERAVDVCNLAMMLWVTGGKP